ncbi:MAG: DUF4340 domain-containing protein [Candidatus Tectomicrobia bacterium]|nr:DUF4340 domain-containing protein [Candidatus Tectomicrobia bacterium]
MNSKKTIIFAAVLACLLLFYYFYEVRGGKARQEAKDRSERVLNFDTAKVKQLTLQGKDQALTIESSAGGWKLTAPLATPGDKEAIEAFLKTVATQKRSRYVKEDVTDLQPYGLEKPRLTLSLTIDGEEKPRTLAIGAENPAGAGVYMLADGAKAVELAPTSLYASLNRGVYDLRDKALLHFAPERLQEIELNVGETRIVLRHGGAPSGAAAKPDAGKEPQPKTEAPSGATATLPGKGSAWHLSVPLAADASQRDVEDLIKLLKEAKVKEFSSESTDELAPYGLEAPKVRVDLRAGDDQASFLLGRFDEKKKGVYARRSGSKQVLLMDEKFIEKLPKEVASLRHRKTFEFERDKVTELEFEAAGERVQVRKKGKDDWEMLAPDAVKADEVRISSFLWDLADIEAAAFVDEQPQDLAAYGLDKPSRWYRVKIEGRKEPQELRIGAKSADGNLVYATMTGWKNVIGLKAKDMEPVFNRDAMMMRFKKLWVFKNADIERVSLLFDGETYELKRAGSEWELRRPKEARLPSWKGAGLLYQLGDAEFAAIVEKSGAGAGDYGFDRPKAKATLWGAGGKEVGTITIGNPMPEKKGEKKLYYVRSSGKEGVYGIEEKFLKDVEGETKELVKGLTS